MSLVGGVEVVGVPVVVEEQGCGQIANCFGDDAPFKWAWCAAKGQTKRHEGDFFMGELSAALFCDSVADVEATVC